MADLNQSDLWNVQSMFDRYCKLVNIDKSKISEVQFRETKQAFVAGLSTYHRSLIANANQPGPLAFDFLHLMEEQLRDFWSETLESHIENTNKNNQ